MAKIKIYINSNSDHDLSEEQYQAIADAAIANIKAIYPDADVDATRCEDLILPYTDMKLTTLERQAIYDAIYSAWIPVLEMSWHKNRMETKP